jgi:hypothetical protein
VMLCYKNVFWFNKHHKTALEPMEEKLMSVLDKIVTSAEVVENLEEELINGEWVQKALQLATRVSYMALEVCDDSTKADWEECNCSKYL